MIVLFRLTENNLMIYIKANSIGYYKKIYCVKKGNCIQQLSIAKLVLDTENDCYVVL